MNFQKPEIGVVVIGRNEGERLQRCLQSLKTQASCIVYVDSGSTDGSVEYAISVGLEVVKLDIRTPFSAARARNEGFKHLVNTFPNIQYFQFIDGDCELCDGWIDFAIKHLEQNKSYAIVAGRRKEKFPENSIFNLLCDIEWDTPIGERKSCGGDFMIRKEAFQEVGGFNPLVVAGEEPELCFRLIEKNWKIYRLNHLMTLHDANIKHFSQWWNRSVRSGHAYAQGFALHGLTKYRYCLPQTRKIWFWAFFFPLSVIYLTVAIDISFLVVFSAYIAQFIWIASRINKHIANHTKSIIYSIFTVLAKWPQLTGQFLYIRRKLIGNQVKIVEYK